jgi:DNA-directed RNA polymerase specialized sigma24 family protein
LVKGESFFVGGDDESACIGLDGIAAADLEPDLMLMMHEQCDRLFAELTDDQMRAIAAAKMEGHTNVEISEQLGCSVSTVERRLNVARSLWTREKSRQS